MDQTTELIRKQIIVNTTSNETKIVLPPMLAFGSTNLRVLDLMDGRVGNTVTEVRHRFMSVLTSKPGAWTDSGTTRSSDSSGTQNIDISGTTDQLWVQVALAGRLSSAGVGEALAGIQAATERNCSIVAQQRLLINPSLNTSESAYYPLGRPHPGLSLTGYMFAIVISGVSGTITFQPAWRSYASILSEPGSWTDLGSSNSDTGNDTYNSGTLSVSPGSATMFAEPGLKITTSARAALDVVVAAKW